MTAACAATPTAVASYTSLASSLCSRWSSCASAGSTGVYTVAWPLTSSDATPTSKRQQFGGPGGSGPGGSGPGGFGGNGGAPGDFGPWGSTFTNPVVTVTGCAFANSPWVGGAGGAGWNGWGDWGAGWTWTTRTATVTTTVTEAGSGNVVVSTGLVAVAEAVSGTVTSTTTLTGTAATATATPSTGGGGSGDGGDKMSGAAPGARGGLDNRGLVVVGALVGVVGGVVLLL